MKIVDSSYVDPKIPNSIYRQDIEKDAIGYVSVETLSTCLFYVEELKKIKTIPGDIVEFGIYRGNNFSFLVKISELIEGSLSGRHKIGFDSFNGFPDSKTMKSSCITTDRDHHNSFKDTSVELVESKLFGINNDFVTLIVGDIKDTLPEFLKRWPNKIALAICDVDIASTTEFILTKIWKRMSPGGKIYLDEYSRGGWSETSGVDRFIQSLKCNVSVRRCGFRPSGVIDVPNA